MQNNDTYKAVSLLIGFALFKARLNLWSRDSVKMEEKEEGQVCSCSALNDMFLSLLFGNLVHHVIKTRPFGERDPN